MCAQSRLCHSFLFWMMFILAGPNYRMPSSRVTKTVFSSSCRIARPWMPLTEAAELPCAHHGGDVCLGPGCCLSGVCQGRTALHLAANEVSGPSNIMRMLLEARASLMAKDVTGLDPQSSLPTGHSNTWSLHDVYQSTWMWSIAFSISFMIWGREGRRDSSFWRIACEV